MKSNKSYTIYNCVRVRVRVNDQYALEVNNVTVVDEWLIWTELVNFTQDALQKQLHIRSKLLRLAWILCLCSMYYT
jgi:hypothetical protein